MQQVDDPPSLPVGTEVSAKYKGAFCEAKVRKVVRNIKVKVAYKQGLGSGIVSDDAIKSGCLLRVGATVEVKHPDKREYIEATITKIQDCSQYTVVFDDGDITTLRRTALCLKSGRHFNESETLDQLPLTHPEHFGNPVIGGRRGRRSRHLQDDSSDDEVENNSKKVVTEKEENVGKIVCVESTETKKKDKEKWFPGLVVSPTAQVTVRIRVKDEYLVRSFKDGRYYTVPKKEATEFTRELTAKQDGPAIQAALEFLDNGVLPPHWDRDALFGLNLSDYDSDSSNDEQREEKDHFVAQLYKFMDDRGTPLNKVPSITNRDVDLYRLYRAVQKLGGYNRVTSQNQWKSITIRLGFTPPTVSVTNLVKQAYKKFLQPFEGFDRKLGCSMSMTPRNSNRSKGRSLVRANSVASPKPEVKEKLEQQKSASVVTASVTATTSNQQQQQQQQVAEESENTSESSNMEVSNKSSKRKLSTGSNKVKTLVDKFEEKNKDESEHPLTAISKSIKQSTTIKDDTTNQVQTTPTSSSRRGEKSVGRKSGTTPVTEEKRGRKKKEVPLIFESEKQHQERSAEPIQVTDFPVEVGDKLKVYYHEKKVTYEAKVIDLSIQQGTPLYLVHYTGWNTRYDEWVPKERIAENISNNKTKRTKGSGAGNPKLSTMTNEMSAKSAANNDRIFGIIKTGAKRGRGRSDSHPSRSSTPSISTTTTRTKSPAAATNIMQRRTTRGQQPSAAAAVTAAAISRRTSNNISDISSSMQTDSDSDSDDAPVKKPTKSTTSSNASGASSVSTQATAGSVKAPTPDDTKSVSSLAANSPSETEEDEASLDVSGTGTNGASAKGRDYDLNQIRSELKGLTELKSPSPEGDAVSSQLTTSSDKTQSSVFSFGGSSTIAEDSVESTKQIIPTNNIVSTTTAPTTTTTTKVTTSSPPINPVIADLKALSSTDLSSETDSFADDDSQSSDKTTTLENMTEKLQQKIKAEKLAQAKCLERLNASGPVSSLSGVTVKTAIEKIAPLKSAGIEKIIKESLAEKMQETLKAANTAAAAAAAASKPFLIEKSIYKPLITSSSVISNVDKDEKPKPSQILEIKTPSKQQQQLQNTFLSKSSPITTPEKKIIAPLVETKTPSSLSSIRGGLEGRKITQMLDKSNTTPQITIKAVQQKDSTSDITITSTSQHFHHNQPMIQQSSSTSSSILSEKSLKDISKSTSSTSSITSSALIKQSTSTAAAAAAAATDVYEFKEPEPFEFEGRKPTSVIIHSNLDVSESKKKKTAAQKIEVMQETKTTATLPMTTPPTVPTTNRRNKKSPLKDQHHHQQQSLSDIRSAKQVKIEEKSLLDPEITQTTTALITTTVSITTTMTPPVTTTSSVSSSGGLLSITKPENPFDALRKSPSFNLNINALNEELATTVQETAKALPDLPATERQIPVTLATPSSSSLSAAVSSSSSSILTPTPALVTPQKLMPSFISPFVESKTYTTDAPHIFEMKSDDESTKSGSDQSSDNKSSKKKTEFETVKKILLSSDSSAFDDLEPPKIEKPSIADKVLKALNQQKQEEKNIIKETSSQSSSSLSVSSSQPSTLIKSEPSSSATRLSEKLTTISEMAQISFSISEPPKIELPAVIKKEIEIHLKKPILSSPEHKLDILESIAPKNNDLSETIQKLESVIQKTSNVDHFDDDSSDSTDSERRLVIEDDSQDSDNNQISPQHQQSSQQQQQQIVEIKNNNISSMASISHSSGTLTQSITTPITITQVTQAINNTKKEPLLKDEDKDFKPITITPITATINKQESSIKPTTIFKTEDILSSSSSSSSSSLLSTKCNISNFSTSKFHHQSSIFNMKPSSIIFSDSSILSDSGIKPIIEFSNTSSPLKIESGLLNQKPKHEMSIIQQQQQHNQSIMSSENNIITIPSHSTITTNSTNFTSTNLIGVTIQIPPPLPSSLKDEQISNTENLNIHSESINLLLCEETIPGSPTPIRDTAIIDIKPNIHPIESDIKPVPMDIECDTIPVGNIANVRIINTSSSPTTSMGIASGVTTTTSSSSMKTSIKCESSGGIGGVGGGGGGSVVGGTTVNTTGTGTGENQTPNSSPRDSVSQDDSGEDLKKHIEQDIVDSTKKRRRTRKHSECELISYSVSKRRRTAAAAALANVTNMTTTASKRNGSDSEDNSDIIIQRVRPTRPCQYNFLVQLDPAMNPNQRISILRKKIQELRKTYNMIKAELASIDRRRKKLRRKKNQQKLLTSS